MTQTEIDWSREKDPHVQESRRMEGYKALFQTPLGQVVLADILRTAGVGLKQGPPTGVPGLRDYEAGRQDAALEIAELAAFNQGEVVKQVIQDSEGYYDNRDQFPG